MTQLAPGDVPESATATIATIGPTIGPHSVDSTG